MGTISPYSMIASACYGGQVSVNRCKQWFADMEVSERAINNEEILNCFITSVPFVSWLFIAISAILLVYHLCFLRIANKRLAPMDFFPEATPEENDDFAKGLGVTYFLPIIEWIITKGIYNVDERNDIDIDKFISADVIDLGENAAQFKEKANSWVRRKIALINDSGVLTQFTAAQIKKLGKAAGIEIKTENKKIVFPEETEQMKILLSFLDEEAYQGPLSKDTILSTSKRRIGRQQ